ncbi:hypothetical protein [Desulfonema magnum]|nr:hypothetical protein [Desulfonema magnum]
MSNKYKKPVFCFFITVLVLGVFASGTDTAFAKGDINCDNIVTLDDIVIALQILCNDKPAKFCGSDDVDGDGKIGLAEVIYGLRKTAGLISEQESGVHLAGQVTESGGLANVKVSAGGISTTTDANGNYRLEHVPLSETGNITITYEKDQYATFQRSLPAKDGNAYSVSAKLMGYDITKSVVQTENQTLEVSDDKGKMKARFDLLPNSLEEAVPGNVSVSIAIGDPSADKGQAVFPGDYMAASSEDSEPDTPLESIAFSEITITDSRENEIKQLSRPARIALCLPDEYQTGGENAGTYIPGDAEKGTIPWWSYNEIKGAWIREDADPDIQGIQDAEVIETEGMLYVRGKVNHLTWWNAGKAIDEYACICVIVEDKNGSPIQGTEVVAKGVSYNSVSKPSFTGINGRVCVNIKQSPDPQHPEKVSIVARAGNIEFPYQVTDASEGEINTNVIQVGDTQAVTTDNSGACYELSNHIRVKFDGRIQGTITREISGSPAPDFQICSNFGFAGVTDVNGQYETDVPLNFDILLFVPGLISKSVRINDSTPVTVNIVLPNRVPLIDALNQDTTDEAAPGQQVVFTASAHDPDNDPITYKWQATEGSLSSVTGPLTTWTAPSGAGTAVIKLTVSDDKTGETSETRTVIWGGTVQGTSLKFTMKDDSESNQPVPDVYVILHGTDNKGAERFIKTDADGIADFGNIGRERATVSIAYEQTFSSEWGDWTSRYIKTFVNVPVGNVIYYVYPSSGDEYYCETPDAVISATLAWGDGGHPADVAWVSLLPFNAFSQDNVLFSNINVCPGNIQDDGKISFLATGTRFDDDYGQRLVKYGFLLDQNLSENISYTIPMNMEPFEISWNTQPPVPVRDIIISGVRKGIRYVWGQEGAEVPRTSGILGFPNEFPVDTYQVSASTKKYAPGETSLSTEKKYDSIPQSLNIPMPNFSFENLSYDTRTMTFSWSFSGTMEKDWMTIILHGVGDDGAPLSWTANMNENATNWTIADLPDDIKSWLNPNTVGESSVETTDMDIYSGFDMYWHTYIEGNDPDAESERKFSAISYFP